MSESELLHYDQRVYLQCQQNQYLYTRGFIDQQLHLSLNPSPECEFAFQQKQYQLDHKKKQDKKEHIVFGTEVLIKHLYSHYYISFHEENGNESIQLKKQPTQACFFELVPQRSFEHKGDSITLNSTFAILHTDTKTYLGSNIFEIDLIKNRVRMQLKNTKILQSYHLTRQFSEQLEAAEHESLKSSVTSPIKAEMKESVSSPFLRKHIAQKDKINEQLLGKAGKKLSEKQIRFGEKGLCLPIAMGRQERRELVDCSMEKHAHTMWRACLKSQTTNPYLQDNDYIYFASSFKSKGIMTVEESQDHKTYTINFPSKPTQNEYECSALFVVEVHQEQSKEQKNQEQQKKNIPQYIYLKHLITCRYFPFNDKNTKKRLKLVPLLPSSSYQNKLPPFHIYFDGEFFPKQFREYQSVCGFWLNKVNRVEVNQILSLESMPHTRWIPYLSDYLDSNRSQKQQLLRQFGFIKHIMQLVVPMMEGNSSLFTLLFKMVNKNARNCKEMAEHMGQLLKNDKKSIFVDILAEILNSGSSFVEKYIQPEHLNHQVVAFCINDEYSLTYIRIFRLFCGTYKEPCHRNQGELYDYFFEKTGEKAVSQQKIVAISIPDKFKFSLQFKEKQVLIENSPYEGKSQAKEYKQLEEDVQRYVRQYFYLLGDCIKKNKENLEKFHRNINYTLEQLIDILEDPQLEDLHGPAMNLINVAYLTPEHKYRLYVYVKDYEQMCFHGGLVAVKSNPSIVRLLAFIHQEKERIKERLGRLGQLREGNKEEGNQLLEQKMKNYNKELLDYYSSSRFKRYLIMVKHSIENGYWRQVSSLELMVDTLSHFYRKKQERVFGQHASYQQCHEQKNYMDSTVLIIDIAILYLDIQINLCISNLITLPEAQVSSAVDAFLLELQSSPLFRQHYDYFHLTQVQNSQMMQKALILSRKYYEIKNIIFQKYYEALQQAQLDIDFKPVLRFVKDSIDTMAQNITPIKICKEYISNCLEGVNLDQLTPEKALSRGFILKPAFKFKKVSKQFQTLAFKLGVLNVLRDSLERYTHFRFKEKKDQHESIYWKLLVVLALIRDNPSIKREMLVFRGQLIKLLGQESLCSFMAIDILEEIYKNNRSLIVADKEELIGICRVFVELMERDHQVQFSSKDFVNVKINKLLQLIHNFLMVQGKPIKVVFSLVLNELFDKDVLITYLCKLNNIQNQVLIKATSNQSPQMHRHSNMNNYLFQVLLYRLTQTLQQKPEKMNFTLPETSHMLDLIMAVEKDNLELTFLIYSLFDEAQITKQKQFEMVFRTTLNMICEIGFQQFKNTQSSSSEKEFSDYSAEVQIILIHMPILIKIIGIIVKGSVDKEIKKMDMEWLNEDSYELETKVQFVEKLFLFNKFIPPRITQQLVVLVKEHLGKLCLQEGDTDRFLSLDFTHLTLDQIKRAKTRLIDINERNFLKRSGGKFGVRRAESRWGQRPSRVLELAEVLKMHINQIGPVKNAQLFKIEKARQFIQSLTFINKSDKTQLNTELKIFFLSFLTNRFPLEPEDPEERQGYMRELMGQQKVLVQFGSAELVTTLLEERFKENYVMFIKLFEYGNKLLEGGNQQAQQSFYEIFLKDHKNRIFENIRSMIEGTTMCLKFCYYNYPRDIDKNGSEQLVYPDDNSVEGEQERQNYRLLLRRVFRFLQLLCENDNQLLKKYIYQQVNQDGVIKYMSVNFLQMAINNFTQILDLALYNLTYPWFTSQDRKSNKIVLDDLFAVLLSILQFLIEVCQYPALKNQLFICNTDFFDNLQVINKLATLYATIYDQSKPLLILQRRIVILLRGLLEQKHPSITDALIKKLAIQELVEFVKLSLSVRNISSREELLAVMMPKNGKLIEEVQNVVDIIIICKALGIELRDEKSLNREVIDEVSLQIRQIQVDFKGKLTTISFCYRPIFNYLSHDTQEFFIKRFSLHQSRNQKLKDVINLRHIINQDIMNRKSRQLLISETLTNSLFYFSIALCFVLVLLQLFFFSVNRMGTALDLLEHSIINGTAILQFFTTILYFILWGIGVSSITREKIKEKYRSVPQKLRKQGMAELVKEHAILLREIYFEEDSSLHTVMMLILSVVGCFIEVRAYSFVILYIFARIQLLRDILSAMTVTWRQLLLVSLLSIAFNFIFGILSINYYINVLYENEAIDIDIDHITSHCSTLIGCIDSLYAQRIIGQTPSRVGDSTHYGRWFSDTVYWSFFQIIIPNLTAAIIIDKFAWLRSIKEKMENEERNKCLICFANKSDIERRGESFEHHKQKKHCIWDYFFYLYYLQKLKDNTEYTGLQYWIVQQLKNQQVDWFPLDETLKTDTYNIHNIYDLLKQHYSQIQSDSPDN